MVALGYPLRCRQAACVLSAVLTILLSAQNTALAGSATWNLDATSDWNTAANWTPATVPNGPADTATFFTSNQTTISLSASTEVSGITFDSGASAFTITANPALVLTISGAGIVNNSGGTQNFVTAVDGSGNIGVISFKNSATAGSLTVFTNSGGSTSFTPNGGITEFRNSSSAANGTFINNGSTAGFVIGGITQFFDTSSAGNGTFVTNGSAVNALGSGAQMDFYGNSTADHGVFTTNGGLIQGADGGRMQFFENSTAGSGSFTNNAAAVPGAAGGFVYFGDNSTAGSGTFTLNGGTGAQAGFIIFTSSASADNGTFTINGSMSGPAAASVQFVLTATAGSATLINNGGTASGAQGGATYFYSTSTAGNAALIANDGQNGGLPGVIQFNNDSTGGTARVELFGNGQLDISGHNAPGLTVGSIEGSGPVFLGSFNLTVGSSDLTTTFSGIIQDGGNYGGTGGSLTKTGKGKLTLTNANTYTGGTAVNNGTLLVSNRTGSATGTGSVQVNTGTLGGTGKIAGAVTVGTGTNPGAIVSPGKNPGAPGRLTINSMLTFNSRSIYKCTLNRNTPVASQIVALGVTINSGASFTFVDTGTGTLTTGTVFTVINNISATPISGTFRNLADGSVFASNGNNFQVNYEGGDGNDLTLTVVP
jgi:autotransporter-associated beta strand protein